MWILMYVFSYSVSPAATNDRAEWRLLPTVVFQEFSNEERCKAAKSTLEGSLPSHLVGLARLPIKAQALRSHSLYFFIQRVGFFVSRRSI